MITIEQLHKVIDTAQLTADFDGTLPYDNEEWIDCRISLETLLWKIMDTLGELESLRVQLESNDLPADANLAKRSIDDLTTLKRQIGKAKVEECETNAQRIVQKLTGHVEETSGGGGDSDYGSACREPHQNPDLVNAVPRIEALLDNLRSTRQKLYTLWQNRKTKIDQCFQLKLFEQDAEKVN